jgi:hypothetical protein
MGPLQHRLHHLLDEIAFLDVGADLGTENRCTPLPFPDHRRLVVLHHQTERGALDCPPRGRALRRADDEFTVAVGQGSADGDGSRFEVEVGPLQPEDLAWAFSFAGLFTFVAGSPVLFMDGFGVDGRAYTRRGGEEAGHVGHADEFSRDGRRDKLET